MRAEAVYSPAAIRRSTEQARREVRRDLRVTIDSLEGNLLWLAEELLPVRRPRRKAPEASIARLLCDDRGRALRYQGKPVMCRESITGFDELVEALRNRVGPAHKPAETLVENLAATLRRCQEIRGRGGRYGAIGSGVSVRILASLPTASELLTDVAAEALEMGAKHLLVAVEATVFGPRAGDDAELRRQLYAQLAGAAAQDVAFAEAVSGDLEPLHALMADPRRPQRLSWQRLAALQLGIVPNFAASCGARSGVSQTPLMMKRQRPLWALPLAA